MIIPSWTVGVRTWQWECLRAFGEEEKEGPSGWSRHRHRKEVGDGFRPIGRSQTGGPCQPEHVDFGACKTENHWRSWSRKITWIYFCCKRLTQAVDGECTSYLSSQISIYHFWNRNNHVCLVCLMNAEWISIH